MPNQDFQQSLSSAAARKAAAVTTSDTTDLPNVATRGLFVVASGTLTIDPIDGAGNLSLGSPVIGTLIPIQVRRVRQTGTTAVVVALS
jgi:hypothetical protein